MTGRRCRWCQKVHKPRFLCDPALKILNALYAKGMEGNMPTVEFPAPIPAEEIGVRLGGDPGDRLLSQITVMGAVVPVADVPFPAVIFSGQDSTGQPLPRWIHVGDDDAMGRLAHLVADMTSLAVRTAAQQRGEARKSEPLHWSDRASAARDALMAAWPHLAADPVHVEQLVAVALRATGAEAEIDRLRARIHDAVDECQRRHAASRNRAAATGT